jgi:hypothetical protein
MKAQVSKFLLLMMAACFTFAWGQSMSQGDPTNRPVPLYSKSDKKKISKFRNVHGIVKDEKDNPVKGALVNLKNLSTNQTLTFITKQDGKYYFDELSREQDYELTASLFGKSTPVKKLSHFDPQTSSMRILSFGEPEEPAETSSAKPK